MSRFVRPETAILHISGGDTLTVKKYLTAGEQRAAFARMYAQTKDGGFTISPAQSWLGLVTTYLIDWSLCDDEGRHVSIAGVSVDDLTSKLDALDMDSFREIKDAIQAHETAMLAAREQEKNARDGATTSAAISPSLDGAAGDTSGSPS